MNLDVILTKPDSAFAKRINDWATQLGVATEDYDARSEEFPEGMLLINANQDFGREDIDLHTLFDKKHIPTQKIDINGTLQVAISSVELWLRTNKCRRVLVLGSDDLVQNENLDRFLNRVKIG